MDSTSSPQFYQCKYGRVRLLAVDNYPDWSTSLINFLKADRTWKIIQGTEEPPTPPAPALQSGPSHELPQDETVAAQEMYKEKQEDYESRAAKACSMILSSVSLSFQQFIYAMTDPKQMWTTLKTQLDSINANAGPYILRAQFYKEKHTGTGPISAFFAKLMQYQTRLASTDFKIQDIDLISYILSYSTLPTKFESTVEVLRLQPNTNWSALTQILINKEVQMNTLSPEDYTTTAMVSNSKFRKNQKPKQNSKHKRSAQDPKTDSKSKDKEAMQCYYCCKRGHKATDCKLRERARKARRHEQKDNQKKTSKDDAAAATANVAVATIADAQIWACYTSIPTAEDDCSFQKAWHLDSGATDYICNDKSAFLRIRRLPKPIQVRIGDNSIVPAVGIGTVLLSTTGKKQY